MLRDDLFGVGVGLVEDALHFAIDLDRGGFGEILMLGELAAEEDGFFLFSERNGTELGHAPLADHAPGHGRGALDVVAGTGGDLADENLLGQAAAHEHGQHRFEVALRI